MARNFTNTLVDYQGGVTNLSVVWTRLLVSHVKTLQKANVSKDPSIYTGGSGIAYALWHILREPDARAALQAHALDTLAVEYAENALGQVRAHWDKSWSLLFREAGCTLVAALCNHNAARHSHDHLTKSVLQAAAEKYAHMYSEIAAVTISEACSEDDFLYGRAGYLMGCLLLNSYMHHDAVPTNVVKSVAKALLQSGHRHAEANPGCGTPLWWEWHGTPYLGAAHGSMGILYTLLNVHVDILNDIPHAWEWIKGALNYILSLECDASGAPAKEGEFPTRMGPFRDREPLMHWCHGAPGAIFLFTQAEKVLQGAHYLPVALRSGEAVWHRGLLKKGPGACHGISGNAYALLRLYQVTGDEKWLHRASQFASFMSSEEFIRGACTPDHPYSLFEGWAAAACLCCDLLHPSEAHFPLFGGSLS